MSFLQVREVPRDSRRVTRRWEVFNQQRDTYLGEIAWWPGWRRYTFQPATGTLYDVNCLFEIAKFIEDRMAERRNERQAHNAPTEAE